MKRLRLSSVRDSPKKPSDSFKIPPPPATAPLPVSKQSRGATAHATQFPFPKPMLPGSASGGPPLTPALAEGQRYPVYGYSAEALQLQSGPHSISGSGKWVKLGKK